MIGSLRKLKEDYLAQLEAQVASIESQRQAWIDRRISDKKAAIDERVRELDSAFANFLAEEQAKLNEKIAKMRAEVADKKQRLDADSRTEAENEIDTEIAVAVSELKAEIDKTRKDLA